MNDPVSRVQNAARLDAVGVDLRSQVRFDRPPLYVREKLVEHVMHLVRGGKSVLLRGPAGVGKTALVKSLTVAAWPTTRTGQLRLVTEPGDSAPGIVEVTSARLVSGTYYANELETKCELVFDAARAKRCVLFIDNAHTLVGAGSSASDPQGDLAHLIVPHLDRGLQLIAATTPEGETRLRAGAEALHARFVVVDVPEPDADEAREIVSTHLGTLAGRGTTVPPELVAPGLDLARRFLPAEPPFAGLLRLLASVPGAEGRAVTIDDLRRTLSHELGVDPRFLGIGETPRFEPLRAALAEEVFSQAEAVTEVADALVQWSVGLSRPGRPIASFLFAGGSGCGKTSLALAAARELTGSADALVRIDMSEYAHPAAAERLIAEEPGSLTSRAAIGRAGVLLFDEVEKAHPVVLRLLLQLLGEARLTDVSGRTVRFDGFVVVLTTNAGARRWAFARSEESAVRLVLADCAAAFPTELLARLTRTVVFRPLDARTGERIVLGELDRLNASSGLAERGLQVVWGPGLAEALARHAVSPERGARGVHSVVRSLVASPLARWLAEHPGARDGTVMVAPAGRPGYLESLCIDWVDEDGFFRERAN